MPNIFGRKIPLKKGEIVPDHLREEESHEVNWSLKRMHEKYGSLYNFQPIRIEIIRKPFYSFIEYTGVFNCFCVKGEKAHKIVRKNDRIKSLKIDSLVKINQLELAKNIYNTLNDPQSTRAIY